LLLVSVRLNFSNWVTNGINLNKKLSKTIIFIVLCLFLITPLTNAERIARSEIPSMNDAWYNTLTKIKDNTTDAIITSWWDFGHWFVAIAERRVTFDGGDQGKRIHWVGRTLRTDSEEEAIGILRMLNCVQETAPEKLDEFTSDSLKSVNILYEIFPISDRTLALEKYQDLGLTKDQAMIMIEYTHCKDLIPNFYITSQDMVGKAGVWGHFGSWDFTKATMYQNTKKLSNKDAVKYLMGNFDLDETAANNVYTDVKTKDADRWIAPWPGYLTGLNGCSREDSKLLCNANLQGNQFIIEVTANTAKIKGTEVVPNSLVYVTPEGISEQELEGDKAGFSLVLIPKEDGYNFILTDPLQAGGMFTRLFYLEAHGLKCFRKFDDVVDPTNQRIITWEVDFGCMQDNKVYFNDKSVTDNLEDTGNNITSNN
jgi:dolichyl-phosphooligosaccharide-protein glycotransferase